MVHLGKHLEMKELDALGHSMAQLLTEILTKERKSMEGDHIRSAFKNFEAGHPIQTVFAKAAVRARLEYNNTGELRNQGMAKPGERISKYENAAKRIAFRGHESPYFEEVADIPEFELQLLRLQNSAW